MELEVISALLVFSFVSSVTPGPNNFMLLASGVNFGLRRTLPHMVGIAFGFCSLLLAVGFGLGALLSAFPQLQLVLKFCGGAYLTYLAWRIATSRSMGKGNDETQQPLTFLQAAAFQWVNPKAWVMGVTAMAIYTSTSAPYLSVVIVALGFVTMAVPTFYIWAGFGVALRGFLSDPVRLKYFNIVMGLALIATLWPMLS
ncbi:LysE family translocator [Nitratireductor basaltis]|uniref:Lysine exporter protein LysE/YggA n=1 Tax=Nitratireductor basaltis TaxID=472175 RepID=A0A084U9V5_9HYPH|nr:LysE family translocator [Nitratireductor basaltis]KFB09741.1 Lysine exporter protein LysE/YggA [Nitratireductor basaltis]